MQHVYDAYPLMAAHPFLSFGIASIMWKFVHKKNYCENEKFIELWFSQSGTECLQALLLKCARLAL